jgi:hypothetical protein
MKFPYQYREFPKIYDSGMEEKAIYMIFHGLEGSDLPCFKLDSWRYRQLFFYLILKTFVQTSRTKINCQLFSYVPAMNNWNLILKNTI